MSARAKPAPAVQAELPRAAGVFDRASELFRYSATQEEGRERVTLTIAEAMSEAHERGRVAGRAEMYAQHVKELETIARPAFDRLLAFLKSGDGFGR